MPAKRHLSGEEKRKIREMIVAGRRPRDIADEMDCAAAQISGMIRAGQAYGRLPAKLPILSNLHQAPVSVPEPVATQEAPLPEDPMNPLKPASPPASASPAFDLTKFGFNIVGSQATGFSSVLSQPQFSVERTHPPHGLLGTHKGEFDAERLARTYGSGTYKIVISLPGSKDKYIGEQVVSDNYGAPKFPAREGEDEDRIQRVERRPLPYPAPDPYGRHPYDYASRGPLVVGEHAAAAAIQAMGDLQKQFIQREVDERKTGPSAFLQDFIKEQDRRAAAQRDEERAREDARRSAEEARWRREREEADLRWKREEEQAQKRHDHALEILREEQRSREKERDQHQQALLKIEAEKTAFLQSTNEAREKATAAALARSQEDMGALREEVKEEIAKGKRDLEKDHALRSQMLEKEHQLLKEKMTREQELLTEKLQLERQIATANTTESLVRGVKEMVTEVRKGLGDLLEHKKMEMGYIQGPGNVTKIPDPNAPVERAAHQPSDGKDAQTTETQDMDEMIAKFMKDPSSRSLVTEWARQVASEVPPGSFIGFFMDGYQDPLDHGLRKACRTFAVFMRTRDWKTVLATLQPNLRDDERKAFSSAWADEFYEAFRYCVLSEIDGYWAQVAAAKQAAGTPEAPPAEAPKKEEAKAKE